MRCTLYLHDDTLLQTGLFYRELNLGQLLYDVTALLHPSMLTGQGEELASLRLLQNHLKYKQHLKKEYRHSIVIKKNIVKFPNKDHSKLRPPSLLRPLASELKCIFQCKWVLLMRPVHY